MAHYDLIDAFDDCVERLRAGQNMDDCARAHPQHAALLRGMLETGLAVRRAHPAMVSASPAARARVLARVMRAATSAPPARRRAVRFPRPALTWAAASLLVVAFVAVLLAYFNRDENHLRTEPLPLTATATPTLTATSEPTATLTAEPTDTLQPTATPTVQPSDTPTNTPSVTATLTPTITPTPECHFNVTAISANLREGPGTGYMVAGYGFAGDSYRVSAIHANGEWVEVITADQKTVWVAISVGALAGACDGLPVSNMLYLQGDTGSSATAPPAAGGDSGDDGGDDGDGGDNSGDDGIDDEPEDEPEDDGETDS
jgi:hypothetical protein